MNTEPLLSLKSLRDPYLKWFFTYMLAALPLFFNLYKQIVMNGTIDTTAIFNQSEIYFVCIVIIAEPLIDLMLSRNKGLSTAIILISSIFLILSLTYTYTVVDTAEHDPKIFETYYSSIMNDSIRANNMDGDFSLKCNISDSLCSQNSVTKLRWNSKRLKYQKDLKSRIQNITSVFLQCSLVLGAVSVFQAHSNYLR